MRGIKGFTLIELLIAISIIAVLSTLAMITFANFQKNARDAKRQSDLNIVKSALEQYHSDKKNYPRNVVFDGESSIINGTRTYLSKVPLDPNNGTETQYCYEGSGTCSADGCTKYVLYTKLENGTTDDFTCAVLDSTPVSGYNLKVTPP